MQGYGGMEAFMKLYTACKNDVETIDNGIKANEEQIQALGYWREDISTYRRTKPIYKQYEETKFFKERFLKKHERDITAHELAAAELRNYPKPLPKVREIDEKIHAIKTVNAKNYKALSQKKAELKQLGTIRDYLYHLNLTHQPPPQRQQTQEQTRTQAQIRKRSYDYDR
jgi:hypothetical protein